MTQLTQLFGNRLTTYSTAFSNVEPPLHSAKVGELSCGGTPLYHVAIKLMSSGALSRTSGFGWILLEGVIRRRLCGKAWKPGTGLALD